MRMKLLFLLPTALPSTPLAVTPLGERQRGEEGGRTERERERESWINHTRGPETLSGRRRLLLQRNRASLTKK